jgi:hypothetical protein
MGAVRALPDWTTAVPSAAPTRAGPHNESAQRFARRITAGGTPSVHRIRASLFAPAVHPGSLGGEDSAVDTFATAGHPRAYQDVARDAEGFGRQSIRITAISNDSSPCASSRASRRSGESWWKSCL